MLRIVVAGAVILLIGTSSALASIALTHAAFARASMVKLSTSVDDAQRPAAKIAPDVRR